MRTSVIERSLFDVEDRRFLKRAAKALSRALGPTLSDPEWMALVAILNVFSISVRTPSGDLVITTLEVPMGIPAAVAVAVGFSETEGEGKSLDWWTARYQDSPKSTPEYRDAYERMLGRLFGDRNVRLSWD